MTHSPFPTLADRWSGMFRRTVDASVPVIDTAGAKLHLRVDHADEDALRDALVAGATHLVEVRTDRALLEQTWRYQLDEFPAQEAIELYPAPILSVESITYLDGDGALQTLPVADYQVDSFSEPGRVAIAPTVSNWPDTEDERLAAVTIEYKAGYGTAAADVPEGLVQAVKLLVGNWYENREATTPVAMRSVPEALDALLWAYRWGAFA